MFRLFDEEFPYAKALVGRFQAKFVLLHSIALQYYFASGE